MAPPAVRTTNGPARGVSFYSILKDLLKGLFILGLFFSKVFHVHFEMYFEGVVSGFQGGPLPFLS